MGYAATTSSKQIFCVLLYLLATARQYMKLSHLIYHHFHMITSLFLLLVLTFKRKELTSFCQNIYYDFDYK